MKYFANAGEGEWWFETISETKTHVKWRHACIPASRFTLPILWVVATVFWAGYMKKALKICKTESEA